MVADTVVGMHPQEAGMHLLEEGHILPAVVDHNLLVEDRKLQLGVRTAEAPMESSRKIVLGYRYPGSSVNMKPLEKKRTNFDKK